MNSAPRRLLLFLACAVVLLAAGYLWGASREHDKFYSPEALLDRELVNLDFNSRVLYHINQGHPAECRRELVTQIKRQMVYLGSFLADTPTDVRNDAMRKLQRAQAAIADQTAAPHPPLPVAENTR